MKILFATPHLFPDVVGGSGLHSFHLIRHLAAAGHTLDVLHPYETVHFAQFPQIREHTVPFGRTVMDFAGHVNRWVGSRQYDLGYSDGLALARYVKRKSCPVVVNDHGLLQFQPQYFGDYLRAAPRPALKDLLFYWPRIRARTRLARRADYVVSMGGKMDELVEDRLGVPAPRILHLPNAVAGTAAEPPRTGLGDPRLFLFVGTIEFRKGMTQVLQAFRKLQDRGIRLRLVGDGPMAPEIRRSRLSNIELVGQKFGAALRREYQAAGAFLYPSLQEGMPTAIMEAMSHGRPVIATDVGATRLLVTPATGLLLAPHDSQAIVQAVTQMTTWDDETRRAMGQAGRQLIQTRYTWDRVAPRYIHGFVRAVERAAPATGPARPVPNGAGC